MLLVDLRPARAPHPPRAEPDPPGCPPGGSPFLRQRHVRQPRNRAHVSAITVDGRLFDVAAPSLSDAI